MLFSTSRQTEKRMSGAGIARLAMGVDQSIEHPEEETKSRQST